MKTKQLDYIPVNGNPVLAKRRMEREAEEATRKGTLIIAFIGAIILTIIITQALIMRNLEIRESEKESISYEIVLGDNIYEYY